MRGYEQVKTHQVDWVWIDGEKQKRVRFATQAQAAEVALGLKHLKPTGCFPTLLAHKGRDVFVEYVPKDRAQMPLATGVAQFYQALYHHQLTPSPSRQPSTLALVELGKGLADLCSAGWIDEALKGRIDAYAHRHAPAMLATGYDYVDAVSKNFLPHEGRWLGIDVEAIEPERWLGLGLAKAEYRGVVKAQDPANWGIQDAGWIEAYPIVRLSFLVSYFNAKRAQGKPGHIRIDALLDAI